MPYKNKEDKKEYMKEYYKNNKEDKNKYNREYYKENKKDLLKKSEQWYKDNPKKRRESNKQWQKNNPEKFNKCKRRWCKNNSDKITIIKKRCYERNKTGLNFKINNNMRCAMWRSLKGNKGRKHWENLVGYDVNKLKKHLQKTMPQGYTWQDYLNGNLHIDHKIPVTAFNFSKPEHIDFQKCWSLKNLQLLPARENIIKRNKLSKPFQPALGI